MKLRGSKGARPPLAPRNRLVREIQAVLDLIRPHGDVVPAYNGYCGAATEAYLHLARESGEADGLRVMRRSSDHGSHWWLLDSAGRVIDLNLSSADRQRLKIHPRATYPYEEGKGGAFQANPGPSKRAAAIIELVKSRRKSAAST